MHSMLGGGVGEGGSTVNHFKVTLSSMTTGGIPNHQNQTKQPLLKVLELQTRLLDLQLQ